MQIKFQLNIFFLFQANFSSHFQDPGYQLPHTKLLLGENTRKMNASPSLFIVSFKLFHYSIRDSRERGCQKLLEWSPLSFLLGSLSLIKYEYIQV